MHLRSREEINLIRLLSRCEEMAAEKQTDWRLERYVEALKEKLDAVQNLDTHIKPKEDILKEYQRKINFLSQLIETSKIPKTSEKSLANKLLAPSKTRTILSNISVPSGKEIQMKLSSQYEDEMKSELLGKYSDSSSDGLRHRENSSIKDADLVLQHQQKLQEKIAEEMVALTRNLKHNVIASNQIIKSDCQVLSKSLKHADTNYTKLQAETNRLDKHLQKRANWWLWISIALVCAVFLGMIFFIRFFPKF